MGTFVSLEVGTVNNYAGAKVLTDADPGKLGYTVILPMRSSHYPHFIDEETEIKKVAVVDAFVSCSDL